MTILSQLHNLPQLRPSRASLQREWLHRPWQDPREKQQARWGDAGLNGRTVHNKTAIQIDFERYVQGAPSSQTGLVCAQRLTAINPQPRPDDTANKSAVVLDEGFDQGFIFQLIVARRRLNAGLPEIRFTRSL